MRWWPKSEYTAHLEAEVRRLQRREAELVNSILTAAGMQVIEPERPAEEPVAPTHRRPRWRAIGREMTRRTQEAFRRVRQDSEQHPS